MEWRGLISFASREEKLADIVNTVLNHFGFVLTEKMLASEEGVRCLGG